MEKHLQFLGEMSWKWSSKILFVSEQVYWQSLTSSNPKNLGVYPRHWLRLFIEILRKIFKKFQSENILAKTIIHRYLNVPMTNTDLKYEMNKTIAVNKILYHLY